MLVWLSSYLQPFFPALRVVHYLTFRSILATLTAFILSLWLGPRLISILKRWQIKQPIRDDGPQSHLVTKADTPTMGGALILMTITLSTLLWADLSNTYIILCLGMMLGFGLIGWLDDYRKLVQKNSKGLPARWKFFWQFLLGIGAGIYLFMSPDFPTQLFIPFFKNVALNLGILFPLFVWLVIVGSSNAVNLTDGLDGLAIVPTILVVGALGIFAYVTGNSSYAHYLTLSYLPGVGEIMVLCSAVMGAGLGFLWFNAYPAQMFMGDVGALGLGALLGTIAVLIKQELVLVVMGGIFVLETVSVIMQVASFKLTGKRIFKMAPIHHHFELKGWAEPKIIVRFWIISVILVLVSLMTLKLR